MKIYTRRGDSGKTSLIGRDAVDKDLPRVSAYGTVDELNSLLGLARGFAVSPRVKEILLEVQETLFSLGSDLACVAPDKVSRMTPQHWRDLEKSIDELQEELPPLRHFVLPGGSPGAAMIHLGRTVCRRAERLVVSAMKMDPLLNAEVLTYLNRLSDLLFVLARYENLKAGAEETLWKGKAR